jgi:hypothetical protein
MSHAERRGVSFHGGLRYWHDMDIQIQVGDLSWSMYMFPVIIMSIVHVAQILVMYAHKLCIFRSNGKVVYSMLW